MLQTYDRVKKQCKDTKWRAKTPHCAFLFMKTGREKSETLYMKVYVFSASVFVSIPSATSLQKVSHQLGRHQALLAFLCFVHIVVLTHPSFPTFIQTQAAQ